MSGFRNLSAPTAHCRRELTVFALQQQQHGQPVQKAEPKPMVPFQGLAVVRQLLLCLVGAPKVTLGSWAPDQALGTSARQLRWRPMLPNRLDLETAVKMDA